MKLKIEDLFLDNSHKSMNLERRIVVTIPYQNKFYLLISEMNLTFKEKNPKNYGIQNEKDLDLNSEETILTKEFLNESSLFNSFQEEVVKCLESLNEKSWLSFCEKRYTKNKKQWTPETIHKEKNRYLNFNNSVIELWKSIKSEDFILGDNQYVDEWEVFWKYIEMQKLAKKLSYKNLVINKKRKI